LIYRYVKRRKRTAAVKLTATALLVLTDDAGDSDVCRPERVDETVSWRWSNRARPHADVVSAVLLVAKTTRQLAGARGHVRN